MSERYELYVYVGTCHFEQKVTACELEVGAVSSVCFVLVLSDSQALPVLVTLSRQCGDWVSNTWVLL